MRIARDRLAVNGAGDAVHTQRSEPDDDRPVMGSSAGAARRLTLTTVRDHLLKVLSPTTEDPRAALDDAAFEIGRLVAHGQLDRVEMADQIRAAAIRLVLKDGEDVVQAAIAAGFRDGARAAAEERAEEEEGEAELRAADPWHDPDLTLLEDRRGDLPSFPVDVLPPAWQPWLERAARGAGVMPDHVAMPLLAVAAGLVGAARRIRASRSWSEPICLWTSTIGFSGTGKTPGLEVVRRALSRIERSRSDSVEAQRAAHEKKAAAAKAALKSWKREVEAAIKAGMPPPDQPREAGVPPPFVAPRFYVSDATIERLAVLIEARPRGMLMIGDELAGLFANMGRYSSGGSDREFWLEAWNGGHYSVERLGRAPVSLPHLLVSMTGGFQPDKLARSFDRADDGMYARHLFGWPAEPEYKPLADDADEVDPDLQEALMRLIDLPAGEGTEIEPRYIPLDPAAREAFEAFRLYIHTGRKALDGREREWWSKGAGQVLRLAGTLAYLAWTMPSARPTTKKGLEQLMETARRAEEPTIIEPALVEAAMRLWKAYFWPHARAALRQIGITDRHRDARRVLRWLRAHRRTEVAREDIRRDALAQRLDAEDTQRLLDELTKAGWLRARTVATRGRSAHRWDVNPRLLSEES